MWTQGEELDASDEEYSEEVGIPGEHWIFALTEKDYNEISFRERLEALTTLCNMALDGPTIRSCLDARLESQSAEAKRKEAEERVRKYCLCNLPLYRLQANALLVLGCPCQAFGIFG